LAACTRPKLPRYADWTGPTTAFAHATLRISCFLTGCCTGEICHRPWCVSYPTHSAVWQHHLTSSPIPPGAWTEPVFPLHLAFLLAALGIGGLLAWFDRRRRFDGQTFLLFLAVHEGAKFTLEFFRDPVVPAVRLAAGIPAAVGVAILLAMTFFRNRTRFAAEASAPPKA
jgi:phosphatidylglycerol:prolipoprotein diacylglycerol transferase